MRCVTVLCSAALAVLALSSAAQAVINVHIVPHTHDDVGWLKNVDQYYSGANNSIQHAGVRYILNTVIEALNNNRERKFTYVEQAFFQRWWREQSDERKNVTRRLVREGRLNFANGGWCMHDEAAAHYVDMVDQTTLGHRFIYDEFDGYAPTTGWQLDPFGHSGTQAALLSAEAGFDALFFGRLDYQDLANRLNDSSCEFIWRGSQSLGPDAQVFVGLTGEYGGNYGPPDGYDWDHFSNDEPVEDNPSLESYNVKSRVEGFVKFAQWQASHTRGNNILFTMGSDFNYEAAEEWFINLDKIIKNSNLDGRIHAFYSSPADYARAKWAEAANGSVTWPIDQGDNADFFPYADGPHQFWTGYFTSRPAFKRYVRSQSSFMNAVRQIQATSARSFAGVERLLTLEQAMGVSQHHDAVSGTAKQHVAFDYAKRIANGTSVAEQLVLETLGPEWMSTGAFCHRLNESVCPAVQEQDQAVSALVWNQLGQARTEVIAIPVGSPNIAITSGGATVPFSVIPVLETVTNYRRHTNEAKYQALVSLSMPAVGPTPLLISPASADASGKTIRNPTGDVVLENELIAMHFSGATGRLATFVNKETGIKLPVDQIFCFYRSSTGDSASGQASGAYIFRPDSANSSCIPVAQGPAQIVSVSTAGDVAQELTQVFSDYVTQTVRLGVGQRHAEFIFTAGPLPIIDDSVNSTLEQCVSWRQTGNCDPNGPREPGNDKPCSAWINTQPSGYCECFGGRRANLNSCNQGGFTCFDACLYYKGKELVTRFVTPIASNGRMLSDSNGREMLHRRRDSRPTWNFTQTEEVAGNYFPLTTAAAIRDANTQLTVLVDAAMGAGSITDGSLEIMVHRRLVADDGRGVGEPLNETEITYSYARDYGGYHDGPALVLRGRLWVTVEPPASAASVWRPLQDRMYAQPGIAFGPGDSAVQGYSALQTALPPNVQLMTLHSLNGSSVLLRLSHQFGIGEDPSLSQPVSVDLSTLFAAENSFRVLDVVEVSLTNNQEKSAILARREALLSLAGDGAEPHPWRRQGALDYSTDSVITLGPLEIKTFVLTIE